MIVVIGELTVFTVIVVIGELTVVTVIVVIGELTVFTVIVVIGGAYCSYCDSGDRGSLMYSQCIYGVSVDLRTKSNYFPSQH